MLRELGVTQIIEVTGQGVCDPAAPRFVNAGSFPHGPANRMTLAAVNAIGDVSLLRYECLNRQA